MKVFLNFAHPIKSICGERTSPKGLLRKDFSERTSLKGLLQKDFSERTSPKGLLPKDFSERTSPKGFPQKDFSEDFPSQIELELEDWVQNK